MSSFISVSSQKAQHSRDVTLVNQPHLETKIQQTSQSMELLEVVEKRNSGNYLIGFVPKNKQFDLTSLLQNWLSLTNLMGLGQLPSPVIRCYVFVLNMAAEDVNLYEMDYRNNTIHHVSRVVDMISRFKEASTMPMANFKELNIGVTFCCDYHNTIAEFDHQSFNLAHTLTGMLAGTFGLAASNDGMFSRPVRMYDDNVFTQLFDVEGTPTLQLLCGQNRNTQLSFEIG